MIDQNQAGEKMMQQSTKVTGYLMSDATSRAAEYLEGSAAGKGDGKTPCPYGYGTHKYNEWMAGFTEVIDPLY